MAESGGRAVIVCTHTEVIGVSGTYKHGGRRSDFGDPQPQPEAGGEGGEGAPRLLGVGAEEPAEEGAARRAGECRTGEGLVSYDIITGQSV